MPGRRLGHHGCFGGGRLRSWVGRRSSRSSAKKGLPRSRLSASICPRRSHRRSRSGVRTQRSSTTVFTSSDSRTTRSTQFGASRCAARLGTMLARSNVALGTSEESVEPDRYRRWQARRRATHERAVLSCVPLEGNARRDHIDGILAYVSTRLSNARAEAIIGTVRTITRRSFGFHSPYSVIGLITLCCSGLALAPVFHGPVLPPKR
jgi:transposase